MESIFIRRQKLISRVSSGEPLSIVVKELSREFNVSDKAIYADYRKREKWLDDVLNIKNVELAYKESNARHKELYKFTIKELLQAKSPNVRLQAIKLLRDLESDTRQYIIIEGYSQRIKRLKDEIRRLKEDRA